MYNDVKKIMEKITYTYARQNLRSVLDEVTDNADVVYIKSQNGKEVAMIDAREYESLLETTYLFGDKRNAKAIIKAVSQAEKGEGQEIDLQNFMDS